MAEEEEEEMDTDTDGQTDVQAKDQLGDKEGDTNKSLEIEGTTVKIMLGEAAQ